MKPYPRSRRHPLPGPRVGAGRDPCRGWEGEDKARYLADMSLATPKSQGHKKDRRGRAPAVNGTRNVVGLLSPSRMHALDSARQETLTTGWTHLFGSPNVRKFPPIVNASHCVSSGHGLCVYSPWFPLYAELKHLRMNDLGFRSLFRNTDS